MMRFNLGLVLRLLSLLDRNPFSPTYGCFDRSYWHYKTLVDYPSATYQQGVLTLSLLYKNDFEGNHYYHNPKILDYIRAGIHFWSRIQNKDGSFNEWYPNEHSYVATAFTSYAVSEALLITDCRDELAVKALARAGLWLSKKKDELVLNHMAGAVAALYNIYLLTGDRLYLEATQENIDRIVRAQNPEGWLPEYGGADVGYQSLSIDYLAKYYSKSRDERVREVLGKALRFLVYFIHPDGTSGGEYGSRNTKYLFLHGLSILASEFKEAGYILSLSWKRFNEQIERVDDRYFVFFFICNLLQANLDFKDDYLQGDFSVYDQFCKVFPEAGLVSKKTAKYHLICSPKKNGAIRLFSINRTSSKLIFSDVGYFGRLSNGKVVSSQWLNPDLAEGILEDDGIKISIHSPFIFVRDRTFLPRIWLPFRIFNYTFGRSSRVASFFHQWLKESMIVKVHKAPLELRRSLIIKDEEITISDEVVSFSGLRYESFRIEKDLTTIHSPSSRYFQTSDLNPSLDGLNLEGFLNRDGRFRLLRQIVFGGDSTILKIEVNGRSLKEEVIQGER